MCYSHLHPSEASRDRDERLGRRVRVLGTLLEGSPEDGPVRMWIEGLPGTDHLAGSLLDELARV